MSGDGNGRKYVCPGCGQAFDSEKDLAEHGRSAKVGPPAPEELGMQVGVGLGKKMLEEVKRISEDLAKTTLNFPVIGGLLSVECTGSGIFTAFRIDDSFLSVERKAELEVFLVTAANGAMEAAKKVAEGRMNEALSKTVLETMKGSIARLPPDFLKDLPGTTEA